MLVSLLIFELSKSSDVVRFDIVNMQLMRMLDNVVGLPTTSTKARNQTLHIK